MPPIAHYLPSSLIEWPGKITASVVLQGCNFRCPFCHSRDFVPAGPPANEIPAEDVLEDLHKRRRWIDAVVVSGGEPTLHRGLPEFLEELKDLGFLVKLDTNGSNPDMLEEILSLGLADLVALDIKAPLDERYRRAAGRSVDLDDIRRSIRLLLGRPEAAEFRTTVVPGLHDPGAVSEIAGLIPGAPVYYIQNFEPHNTLDEDMLSVRPFPEDDLRRMAEAAARFVRCAVVRGTGIAEGKGCPELLQTARP